MRAPVPDQLRRDARQAGRGRAHLRIKIDAIATLGIELLAPTPTIARDAARYRALNVSLADGFAIATAKAHKATLASFDRRVRRALPKAGIELTETLRAAR